ncbi:hypothetical protein [Lacunisphaera limnophila]|uniref:hypothetical protein n=1 Tax=Lacunisphaera limnophila TaxID=1838286 RepID=UPI0008599729|nr:hypothetical protein [Lacunisphaera limnophila]
MWPPLLLLAAGWVLRPLEPRLLGPGDVPRLAAAGGIPVAVLGGMRSAAAGAYWLRANLAWERQDPVETRVWLERTVAADERPLYFWLNAARMIAHDFPAWRLTADAPLALRQRVEREQAEAALAWLDTGVRRRGPAAGLYLEMADLRLRVLGDREGAARLFRLAAEQPGAPWQAARLHAEMLRLLGRPAEALAWLRQILPGLPADDPAARREVVVQRIAELERLTGG